jgi:acyl dehydratase
MESISLPDGSIHISQEFEFRGLMVVGDTITCQTEVVGKQERGQIRLLTLAMSIFNSGGTEVLTGRIMLTVPPAVLQR